MEKLSIKELRAKVDQLDNEQGIQWLSNYIANYPNSEEAYTLRGMRYWGLGNRASAINDYLSAIKINPNSKAKQALDAANEILDYRNKDLYNP